MRFAVYSESGEFIGYITAEDAVDALYRAKQRWPLSHHVEEAPIGRHDR